MSGETRAKAELALMGLVVRPDSNEEAVEIMDYIIKTLDDANQTKGQDIYDNAFQYSSIPKSKRIVYGICVHTLRIGLDSMRCITVILEKRQKLEYANGIFCWVENLDAPDCSEGGYCFFKQDAQGFYHRIS